MSNIGEKEIYGDTFFDNLDIHLCEFILYYIDVENLNKCRLINSYFNKILDSHKFPSKYLENHHIIFPVNSDQIMIRMTCWGKPLKSRLLYGLKWAIWTNSLYFVSYFLDCPNCSVTSKKLKRDCYSFLEASNYASYDIYKYILENKNGRNNTNGNLHCEFRNLLKRTDFTDIEKLNLTKIIINKNINTMENPNDLYYYFRQSLERKQKDIFWYIYEQGLLKFGDKLLTTYVKRIENAENGMYKFTEWNVDAILIGSSYINDQNLFEKMVELGGGVATLGKFNDFGNKIPEFGTNSNLKDSDHFGTKWDRNEPEGRNFSSIFQIPDKKDPSKGQVFQFALYGAIYHQNIVFIQRILSLIKKYDSLLYGFYGTALHIACSKTTNLEIIKILCDFYCDWMPSHYFDKHKIQHIIKICKNGTQIESIHLELDKILSLIEKLYPPYPS